MSYGMYDFVLTYLKNGEFMLNNELSPNLSFDIKLI